MKLLTLSILVLVLSVPAFALRNTQQRPLVSQIEAYCKDVDAFIKRNSKSKRIFANTSSATEGVPDKWQEFKSDEERQATDTGDNLNETAYVWQRNGKLVGANFTFQSPSRDWAQFVMYYFRQNGTLAKTQETLNTFYGNLSVDRERFYDSGGKLILSKVSYYDLETRRRKKPGRFELPQAPIYRSIEDLPFIGLYAR